MSLSRRRFMTISAGLALGASVPSAVATSMATGATTPPTVWRGIALGADAKLVLTGLPKPEGARLIALARAEINRLETIFSLYRTDSVLSELNRTGSLKNPPPELLNLLSIASAAHTATGGLFDPTIQPLWQTYAEYQGKPPEAAVKAAMRSVGWQQVKFDGQGVFFQKSGMALTLNGIAQGFISDAIAKLLKAEGLQNAIVSLGEISALGHTSTGDTWQVGLATHGDEIAEETIPLTDQSVATSAPTGTTFDGEISHILNPKTGRPATSAWQRLSVIHTSAAMADGLSTGMVLMGEGELRDVVRSVEGVRVVGKRRDGAGGITAITHAAL